MFEDSSHRYLHGSPVGGARARRRWLAGCFTNGSVRNKSQPVGNVMHMMRHVPSESSTVGRLDISRALNNWLKEDFRSSSLVLKDSEYFIQRYAHKLGKRISNISKKTLDQFQSYSWPGDIRELQNVIERSLILWSDDDGIALVSNDAHQRRRRTNWCHSRTRVFRNRRGCWKQGRSGTIGREVFGLNDWYAEGAIAQYCLATASQIATKPARLTHIEAAGVPIGALTAWQGLIDRAELQPGQRVLVHGGAGAVGVYAIQLARRAGAFVISTASQRSFKFLTELGADEVIDYHTERFEQHVQALDVVFDCVGGDTLLRSWDVLKPDGRMITLRATHGNIEVPGVVLA